MKAVFLQELSAVRVLVVAELVLVDVELVRDAKLVVALLDVEELVLAVVAVDVLVEVLTLLVDVVFLVEVDVVARPSKWPGNASTRALPPIQRISRKEKIFIVIGNRNSQYLLKRERAASEEELAAYLCSINHHYTRS